MKGTEWMANRSPKLNGEKVCVCAFTPTQSMGHFLCKSGTMGHFDCCCRCQEPSKQQILGEEKQGQGAEGQSCGHGTNAPSTPHPYVKQKGFQQGLPGRRDEFFCT